MHLSVHRSRRELLRLLAGSTALPGFAGAAGQPPTWDTVTARELRFPADHGAHPGFRTEWWYITGWIERGDGPPLGLQITFFRARTQYPENSRSQFAPTQLLFAHTALALPELGHLMVDQRAARSGFGLAQAALEDTRIQLANWQLERTSNDEYRARIAAKAYRLDLRLSPAAAPVLQGNRGVSAKGRDPAHSSFYYSRPQLRVQGSLTLLDRKTLLPANPSNRATPSLRSSQSATQEVVQQSIQGRAWLDHEWSSTLLAADERGWDWIGINLHDGSSLMAFSIRGDGGMASSSHLAWRTAGGERLSLECPPNAPLFEPLRYWVSPRSAAKWPVAMRLRVWDPTKAKARVLRLIPLFLDQEVDARASTGGYYWEGAVRLVDGDQDEEPELGRGYLELTGYAEPVTL
jgi:predicted secreted hydrolase